MIKQRHPLARHDPEVVIEANVKRLLGLPLTQRETGALLGCSRETVRRHEKNALDKIRAVLMEELDGKEASADVKT